MHKAKLTTIALAAGLSLTSVSAGGITSVLDGMFANVTAPAVVSNQFRGSIAFGGVYVRAPISNLQVVSIDPPRLSAGCGGIDLYLGSFSFITAEKLTQFIRNVAQNAAPLAFKMALDAGFPQLGGVLDKFQTMAQMMNDSQRNSCQLAHGIMDGAKNAGEVMTNLRKTVGDGIAAVKGWATDFTDAFTTTQAKESENLNKTLATKNSDNTPLDLKAGNVTWNALNARESKGILYSFAGTAVESKQILLSLIGTEVNKPGASNSDKPIHLPVPSYRLRLKDLFKPTTGPSGNKEVPIWSCGIETSNCLEITASSFATAGIEGYVRKQMYGSETALAPAVGSIIYKMGNCTSGACGMNAGQLQFLNNIGKIPAVGLMMRSQGVPNLINSIAPELVDAIVDEVSALYGRSVLDLAITTYSNTDLPPPDGFKETIQNLMDDLREAEQASKGNLTRINTMTAFIDAAIRANGSILRFRPQ